MLGVYFMPIKKLSCLETDPAMLHVIESFAKSYKVTEDHRQRIGAALL